MAHFEYSSRLLEFMTASTMIPSWRWLWRGAPFLVSIVSFTLFQTRKSSCRNFLFRSIGHVRTGWISDGTRWRPSGPRGPQSDVVYLYSEYLAESDPAIHASAIRSRAGWIHGLIDVTANGRVQADGCQLIQLYQNLGLDLKSVDNPVESGILNIWQRA